MPKKLTKEEWIEKAEKIHGKGIYDYSEVEYKNAQTKVKIRCNSCGNIFYQTPNNHLSGKGCKECGIIKRAKTNKERSKSKWIERVTKRWSNKLDLTKAIEEYDGIYSEVTVTCRTCGLTFKIEARLLYQYDIGCPNCRNKYKSDLFKLTNEEFIKRAEEIHGKGEYDYSKIEYKGHDIPVLIVDLRRGEEFWQKPSSHLSGHGNPNRTKSRGEILVNNWLEKHDILFKDEVKVDNITGRNGEGSSVRIDFCFNYNNKMYWIEYNGGQHYEISKSIHKNSLEERKIEFQKQTTRDNNVREYCKTNDIILIEIPYTYDTYVKVSEVLDKIILENNNPSDIIVIPKTDY